MTKYESRMQKAWEQVKHSNSPSQNREILLNARDGDCLIKTVENDMCWLGAGYVDFSYKPSSGWFATSTRRNGLWCSKEEGKEILNKLGKGYKMVKKSKYENK